MLISKIRQLQIISFLLLILQLVFKETWFPFHLWACLCSVIVLWNHRYFKVICMKYNYWMIGLYTYRIMIFNGPLTWDVFYFIYFILCFYTCLMGLLICLRCLL